MATAWYVERAHGVAWLANEGDLSFSWHRIGGLFGAQPVTAADLDGDGDLDVVAVAFLPQLRPETWETLDSVVWFERTALGYVTHSIEKGRPVHPSLATADYDADGDMDIAVGNYVRVDEQSQPTAASAYVTLFTQK